MSSNLTYTNSLNFSNIMSFLIYETIKTDTPYSKPVLLYTMNKSQGPVVQSVVRLTSSYRVILLTVLVDLTYNILIFFAEKM